MTSAKWPAKAEELFVWLLTSTPAICGVETVGHGICQSLSRANFVRMPKGSCNEYAS